jgi:integrase
VLRGKASIASARSHLAVLRRDLGSVAAKELDYDRLSEIALAWQRDAEAPVKPATVNRRFAILRRAYRRGRRSKRVAVVPEFPHFEELNAREGFFERGEFVALLAALPDDGLRDFVEWGYWTGMRKREAASLQWRHLDQETWTVRLPARHAKTRQGRALALRGAFRTIIERRLAARQLECPYIFHRYDITTEDDLAEAADRVTAYVAALPATPTVTTIERPNVHNSVKGRGRESPKYQCAQGDSNTRPFDS